MTIADLSSVKLRLKKIRQLFTKIQHFLLSMKKTPPRTPKLRTAMSTNITAHFDIYCPKYTSLLIHFKYCYLPNDNHSSSYQESVGTVPQSMYTISE